MSDDSKNRLGRPKPKQDEKGRFVAGNGGNGGRPKGSRNKLGEAFVADIYTDWLEHGVEAVQKVRNDRPHDYLKVIASILPRDLHLSVNEYADMPDDALVTRIRQLQARVKPFLDEGGEGDPEKMN